MSAECVTDDHLGYAEARWANDNADEYTTCIDELSDDYKQKQLDPIVQSLIEKLVILEEQAKDDKISSSDVVSTLSFVISELIDTSN